MSFQNSVSARASTLALFLAMLGCLVAAGPSRAVTATATVRDANSIQLGDVTYRLDGIDAPELDQICIDDQAEPWTCGLEARDQLTKLIGGRPVRCDDLGPDNNFKKRHIGVCTVEGEPASLNQQLVQQGFAMDFEPSAKG